MRSRPTTPVRHPLVIVGTGRCGSTLLHTLLIRHRRVAWLSELCARAPRRPRLNALLMHALDVPGAHRPLLRVLDPAEAYELWRGIHAGFPEPCRDLREADATPAAKARAQRTLGTMLTRRRDRLLLKITGWPRTGFLRAILPGARFVHIRRDGRSVASSLLAQPWWPGWQGPSRWGCGPLTREQHERWERHGRSFAVLAGLEWEILMDAFAEAARPLADSEILQVDYEELCREPEVQLRRVLEFADLEWTPSFAREVRSFSFENANDRWRSALPAEEREALEAALAPALARHGFSPRAPVG